MSLKIKKTLIDNSEKFKLSTYFNTLLEDTECTEICIATGYWDLPGTKIVYEKLNCFLERGGKVKLIIGQEPMLRSYQRKKDYEDSNKFPDFYIKRDINQLSDGVRTGKIMLYNPDTGKRIKTPYNHITWVHSLQKLPNFNLRQCFFGEYLLSQEIQKPVAIVESEKTALIASHYLPQYLWIATGGKNGCFRSHNLTPLLKRQIVLFPDLGAADYWQEKLKMMRDIGLEVHLFDYLEKQAPPDDLRAGYDIADYLLKIETKKENPENLIQHAQNYPKEDENVKTNIGDNAPKTKPMPRKKGIKF